MPSALFSHQALSREAMLTGTLGEGLQQEQAFGSGQVLGGLCV